MVRVHELVPESVWRPRYEQINMFERILTENGVTILKFFLHISREEQRERLRARLDDPGQVLEVFGRRPGRARQVGRLHGGVRGGAARGPAPPAAPWYVVPADKKYLRDLLVAQVVAETLERMDPKYPGPPKDLGAVAGGGWR